MCNLENQNEPANRPDDLLPEFATCFKTKLPENMIYIIFPEALP